MSKNIQSEILKYIDGFGTKFTFYTEKNRKFYTPLGGILTLLSIIFGALAFIYINIDDFLHNNPSSTTSILKENYRNIKFKEEKIWIPWRLRDYDGKTVNHTGLLYPIIYYYIGVKNEPKKGMNLSYNIINYRLCNETSMKINSDSYLIFNLNLIYNLTKLSGFKNYKFLFLNFESRYHNPERYLYGKLTFNRYRFRSIILY